MGRNVKDDINKKHRMNISVTYWTKTFLQKQDNYSRLIDLLAYEYSRNEELRKKIEEYIEKDINK